MTYFLVFRTLSCTKVTRGVLYSRRGQKSNLHNHTFWIKKSLKNINFFKTKIDFQNSRSKKCWDFFLRKKNNFSEHRNFRWKNIFQKNFRKIRFFEKFSEKYFFIGNFEVPKIYIFFEEKISIFFRSRILKIDFSYEKFNIF